jgi:hypothetical protein
VNSVGYPFAGGTLQGVAIDTWPNFYVSNDLGGGSPNARIDRVDSGTGIPLAIGLATLSPSSGNFPVGLDVNNAGGGPGTDFFAMENPATVPGAEGILKFPFGGGAESQKQLIGQDADQDTGISVIGDVNFAALAPYAPFDEQAELYAELSGTVGIAFDTGSRSIQWYGAPGDTFGPDTMSFTNTGTDVVDVDVIFIPAQSGGFFGYPNLDGSTDPNFWVLYTPSVTFDPAGGATAVAAGATYFSQSVYTNVVTDLDPTGTVDMDLTMSTAANTPIGSEQAKIVIEATVSDALHNEYLNPEAAGMEAGPSGLTNGMTAVDCTETAFTYDTGLAGYTMTPTSPDDCVITYAPVNGVDYTYYDDVVDFCVEVANGVGFDGSFQVDVQPNGGGASICTIPSTPASGFPAGQIEEFCCGPFAAQAIDAIVTIEDGTPAGNVEAFRIERQG